MRDKSAASLALELVRRVRVPSLPTIYWILRIALLIVGFLIITNWADIVKSVGVMFSGKVTEAVTVIDEKAKEVKIVIDDGVTEITDKQRKIQESLDGITDHKNEIIQEFRKAFDGETKKHATTPTTSVTQSQPIEQPTPVKIIPSSQLSNDDEIIETEDESLYATERKRTTIRPSSD